MYAAVDRSTMRSSRSPCSSVRSLPMTRATIGDCPYSPCRTSLLSARSSPQSGSVRLIALTMSPHSTKSCGAGSNFPIRTRLVRSRSRGGGAAKSESGRCGAVDQNPRAADRLRRGSSTLSCASEIIDRSIWVRRSAVISAKNFWCCSRPDSGLNSRGARSWVRSRTPR